MPSDCLVVLSADDGTDIICYMCTNAQMHASKLKLTENREFC